MSEKSDFVVVKIVQGVACAEI
ncbi:MAG: hypothetical protein H6Q39_1606, partial [Chloroflexi bacterium]|nr:hypothetical protein [Chloroflexota bacterium]